MPISLSAGVAVCPEDASDAATLVSRALACQQLARSAENTDVVVYDADVVDAADPLVRLERARLRSHRAKLRALASAADARDLHTRHRSDTVAEIVSAFAIVLELSAEQTRVLEVAARVYNVGYVGIPDEILLKPGRLTAAEREIVAQHPVLAERLLAPAGMPESCLRYAITTSAGTARAIPITSSAPTFPSRRACLPCATPSRR